MLIFCYDSTSWLITRIVHTHYVELHPQWNNTCFIYARKEEKWKQMLFFKITWMNIISEEGKMGGSPFWNTFWLFQVLKNCSLNSALQCYLIASMSTSISPWLIHSLVKGVSHMSSSHIAYQRRLSCEIGNGSGPNLGSVWTMCNCAL